MGGSSGRKWMLRDRAKRRPRVTLTIRKAPAESSKEFFVLRHQEYTRDRIRQLTQRIHGRIYPERKPAQVLLVAGPTARISYQKAQELPEFSQAQLGQNFGPMWSTFWFR